MPAPSAPPAVPSARAARRPRAGYWWEVARRYRKSRIGMAALGIILLLAVVAAGAPFLAGSRPIVCRFRGKLYFPALAYFSRSLENPVFAKERFRVLREGGVTGGDRSRIRFPRLLAEGDPESWAVWPLHYADPDQRVEDGEWRGRPGDPYKAPPSLRNPFGTDSMGRDVLARMAHGTSIALAVGFVAMGFAAVIGIFLGALAGYAGGWVDLLLSRLIELVQSIPAIILVIALLAVVEKPSIWLVMAVLGCTRWVPIARFVRGEFLRLKEAEFVLAARALGVRTPVIVLRHILPNALSPVIVAVSFGIAGAILLESALSFLGLGTDPNGRSWGRILDDGFQSHLSAWWLVFFPGGAIFAAVLTYNLAGDTFQEALDPRRRS